MKKQEAGKDLAQFDHIKQDADESETDQEARQDPPLVQQLEVSGGENPGVPAELKKEVNIETFTSGQYTIQIFNGKYNEGSELMDKLISEKKFEDVFFSFETPYYKIRIGKYVSKMEAIKKLKIIKKTFKK